SPSSFNFAASKHGDAPINSTPYFKQLASGEGQQINDISRNFLTLLKVYIDSTITYSTPEFGLVDRSAVDIILISNYQNLLALPFITEYSKFKGKVFATEPTIQIGKQIMEELLLYDSVGTTKDNPNWHKKEVLR